METVVQQLSEAQASLGSRVIIAAVGAERPQVEPFLSGISDSVDALFIETPDRGYLRERRRVAQLCRKWRPDVLHTHGFRPDVVDAGVARALEIPTVSTVHGFTGDDLKTRAYEWIQRHLFRRFDAVVAVSRPLAVHLLDSGVPRERLHIVRNEMPALRSPMESEAARRTLNVPPERFHIGWVGRLGKEKGPDVLLDALARLQDMPVLASIVGEGRMQGELEERARSAKIGHIFRWHGRIPQAAALFSAFDVFVLSSRTEGTPMVLFEAMAAGVPIVATSVGGVPDVLGGGKGLLVAPDDPDALAQAIRDVHNDPAAARDRADGARRELEADRDPARWAERYDEVYRSAMRSASSRASSSN